MPRKSDEQTLLFQAYKLKMAEQEIYQLPKTRANKQKLHELYLRLGQIYSLIDELTSN